MGTMPKVTKTQLHYLSAMEDVGLLKAGWGGFASTLTVRILAERGLCTLREFGPGDWQASITKAGRALLAEQVG
jgi:hypothetical protein